jgi:radical SAM protein with 4Fe4S-binding SPASM domain
MNLPDITQLFSGAPKVSAYPKTVIIETTNACNLRCKMCHVWGEGVVKKREVGFIQERIWEKAIDELSCWDENIGLALHGAGEPILHRDFLKILDYAASKKNIFAGFLSNGSLWSREIVKAILDTDVAWIGFSVDGADPEKYKKYRGTDLKKVESVIEHLVSLRKNKKPSVFLNMVALPDLDPEKFLMRWIDKVDEVKISIYRPIGHRDFLTEKRQRIPCYLLNEMLVIAWNGKAVLCCEDIWAENIVGNFPEQSLHDIWHSISFDRIRRLHENGKYKEIPICAHCDTWSNIFTQTELEEFRNLRIVKSAAQTCYSRIRNALHQE